jgi:hypothetical protein
MNQFGNLKVPGPAGGQPQRYGDPLRALGDLFNKKKRP